MRMFFIAAAAAAMLAGCGADTATTAATSAAIKKRELEEGKKTMEQVRGKIDQSLDQGQQRNERDAEK